MEVSTKKVYKKFYVVWRGKKPGIYSTWEECKAQLISFPMPLYKSYKDENMAKQAFAHGSNPERVQNVPKSDTIIEKSISVSATWDYTSDSMEYCGVYTDTKEIIFKQGPYSGANNHIGCFLAIVHALAHCKKHQLDLPIYSDNEAAIAWIRKKKYNSKVEHTAENSKLFELLSRADKWLGENVYTNQVNKWRTDEWGEIAVLNKVRF